MPANPEFASFLCTSALQLNAVAASALAAEMWPASLQAGEYLFHQGDPTSSFHVLYRGKLEVRATSIEGKELVFTTLEPGAPIGEATIVDGSARSAAIYAPRKAEVLSIARGPFLELAHIHAGISLALARLAAETLRRLSSRVEDDTFVDIETRLARLVISLGGEHNVGGSVEVKVTQQALADRLGVTRESVNKYLGAWADEGLVELRRGRIVVTAPHLLIRSR